MDRCLCESDFLCFKPSELKSVFQKRNIVLPKHKNAIIKFLYLNFPTLSTLPDDVLKEKIKRLDKQIESLGFHQNFTLVELISTPDPILKKFLSLFRKRGKQERLSLLQKVSIILIDKKLFDSKDQSFALENVFWTYFSIYSDILYKESECKTIDTIRNILQCAEKGKQEYINPYTLMGWREIGLIIQERNVNLTGELSLVQDRKSVV